MSVLVGGGQVDIEFPRLHPSASISLAPPWPNCSLLPRGRPGDPFSVLDLGLDNWRFIHFLLGFGIFSIGLSLRISNLG